MVTDGSLIYTFLPFVDKSPSIYKLKDIVSCTLNSELNHSLSFVLNHTLKSHHFGAMRDLIDL